MEEQKKPNYFSILFFPVLFIAAMWVVKLVEINFDVSFAHFGIYPRELQGLIGILLSPLIHGDIYHLIDNSVPMLVLGMGIWHFYKPVAFKVFAWTYLMTGLWIWAAARPAYHIGASGLIYAFASFIFFSGIFRKYYKLLALSMLVVFLYGGMVWGIFPLKQRISWESHLLGSVAGLIIAIHYRKIGPKRKQFDWELEDEDDDEINTGDEAEDDNISINYHYKPGDKE